MKLIEIGLGEPHVPRIDPDTHDPVRDENGEIVFDSISGPRVLRVEVPDADPVGETFLTVTHPSRGVVAHHSPTGPTWVSCAASPALEAILAEHYGCSSGRPADVEDTHWTLNGPPGTGAVEGG